MKIFNMLLMFLVLVSVVFAAGVEIMPVNPNTDDNLFCSYEGATSGFTFNWFVNNVYVTGGNVLDDSYTGVNNLISCDAWMIMPGQDIYVGTGYATIVNRDPVVSDIPDVFMDEDSVYTIDLSPYVVDPDGDMVIWGAAGNNINVVINGNIATLTPLQDWNGVESITFTATDVNGGADSDDVTVTVNPVDDAPVITDFNPFSPSVNVNEGDSQLFDVVVLEVDGDTLGYEWYLDGNLVGMTASYTYDSIDGPDNHGLMVVVSDGITDVFNVWDINDINVAPGVNVVNSGPINEGENVLFTVNVNDPGVLDTHLFSFDFDNDGVYDIIDQFSNAASYTFIDSGNFNVGVMVRDNDGGVGYGVDTVIVNDVAPVADAGGPYICQIGTSITLVGNNDGYSGDLVQYSWDLDDDGLYDDSSLQNPVYDCNTLGTFDVSLRVTDDENGFNTDITYIDVVDYPVNNAPVFTPGLVDQTAIVGQVFTYDIDAVDPDGDLITFSDDSGLFDIDANTGLISFTPSATGLSYVTITVCDDYVPSACTSDSFDLDIDPAPNTAPGVVVISPVDGDVYLTGDSVFFDGSAMDNEDGDISSWIVWDSSIDGVLGTGIGFNINTLSVGTHVITASVTDSGGLSDSDNVMITVNLALTECNDGVDNDSDGLIDLNDPGCADLNDDDETDPPVVPECADGVDNDSDGLIDYPNDPGCSAAGDTTEQENPVAIFTVSSNNVNENENINFNASSSYDTDGTIVSYVWDFGDGDTGNGVSVSHGYSKDGIYDAVLTVTDNDGLTDVYSVQITVNSLVPSVTGNSGDIKKARHDIRIEDLRVVNNMVIFDVVNDGNVKERLNVDVIFREAGVVNSLDVFVLNKESARTFSSNMIGFDKRLTIEVRVYNDHNDVSDSIIYNMENEVFAGETGFVALDSQTARSKENNMSLVIWGLLVLLMVVLVILALTYVIR